MPSFAEVKVLQQQNMLNVHHMHTWVCTVFKWNYEQHLYTHTLIPIINRFASTNEPLSNVERSQRLDGWPADTLQKVEIYTLLLTFSLLLEKKPHSLLKKLSRQAVLFPFIFELINPIISLPL